LAGFAAAIYAVLTGYRRSRTLHEVLDGVFTTDPMAHISRGYSETLRALIGAVEARDAYTHGHSARVAELSVHIGLRLGLRPAGLRTLAEGAYLHDVGKVGIPDHVLNKPGALTGEERAWVQQHPLVGSDIVGRAPSLRDAIAVIRQHHERYDGSGYFGLVGEHIPLGARVIAVADALDAMTSDRPYRPAMADAEALGELERGRGTQFDPRVVQAVLDLLDFIAKNPKHPLAPNAQYWIGEAYYVQRDYRQALVEFQRVIEMAPGSPKAADALLKMGLAHTHLRENSRAQQAWQRVVRDYPASESAGKARALLRAHAARRP